MLGSVLKDSHDIGDCLLNDLDVGQRSGTDQQLHCILRAIFNSSDCSLWIGHVSLDELIRHDSHLRVLYSGHLSELVFRVEALSLLAQDLLLLF